MNKYHKWTINDGDYIRNEEDISIANPEKLNKRLKRWTISIIWKVTLLGLLAFLFLRFI